MWNVAEILDTRRSVGLVLAGAVVAVLVGCGQKGPLYIPPGEAAAQRATLPQTLSPAQAPALPTPPASAPPVTGTATPAPRP